MPIIRTRNIADPLSSLEDFIQQSEQTGGGLVSVVAGTVQGSPFNVISFVFEPRTLPPIALQRINVPIDTDEQRATAGVIFRPGGAFPCGGHERPLVPIAMARRHDRLRG